MDKIESQVSSVEFDRRIKHEYIANMSIYV